MELVDNDTYPLCHRFAETSGHILWGCISAQDVWGQGCKKIQKLSVVSDSFLDIWSTLTSNLNATKLEEVAYVISGIWLRRYKKIFKEHFSHPNLIIRRPKQLILNFYKYQSQLKGFLRNYPIIVFLFGKNHPLG